jgi:hypothetical protein
VGTTRENDKPGYTNKTDASRVNGHTRRLSYIAPTPKALVRFEISLRGPQFQPPGHISINATDVQEGEPQVTPSAEVEIHYRGAQTRFKVPGGQAGHLLDSLTCGLGIVGIVVVCIAILKSGDGSPIDRIALCVLCTMVIGTLTAVTINRNRR